MMQTDWLASNPVFYNQKTGKISHCIHDVIEYANMKFDPEGLNNYLEYGYSVFGQTPIENVRFLEPCSSIMKDNSGHIHITKEVDPILKWKNKNTKVEELIETISSLTNEWVDNNQNKIILPLSGGYDSRFLASVIKDKDKIRTFTYGISEIQSKSFEIIKAQEISKRLDIEWQQIDLDDIHDHIEDWDNQFGVSVHAHGMYQMSFYSQIRSLMQGDNIGLISGIFGDLWAGNLDIQKINSPKDLIKLSYNHGICIDRSKSLIKSSNTLRNNYWEKIKDEINDPYIQTIEVIRTKMILISYLLTIPQSFGFHPWSPFLCPEVALGMLTLPQDMRHHRLWQEKYFKQNNIYIENVRLYSNNENTLNLQAINRGYELRLDRDILSEIIDRKYVDEINNVLRNAKQSFIQEKKLQKIFNIPKLRGLLSILGFKDPYSIYNKEGIAYNAFRVLKPLENAIRRRNNKQNESL